MKPSHPSPSDPGIEISMLNFIPPMNRRLNNTRHGPRLLTSLAARTRLRILAA